MGATPRYSWDHDHVDAMLRLANRLHAQAPFRRRGHAALHLPNARCTRRPSSREVPGGHAAAAMPVLPLLMHHVFMFHSSPAR